MHRIHPHIKAVMDEVGEDDPVRAVRIKARFLLQQFVDTLGGTPPLNLEAFASFCGLVASPNAPKHSPDSEIAPEGGRVVLRVNRDRPLVRQRFSIGHEIGHTLFPDYELAVRCRKPVDRDWADPSDLLETLCDVAASEFLFPSPWFEEAVQSREGSAAGIRDLANRFVASPEATIRRFVDVSKAPVAALFCSWKLKPSEIRQRAADRNQSLIFDGGLTAPEPKLRVDYSVLNDGFKSRYKHIPKDKSLPMDGPILQAAQAQEPCDGTMWLELGTVADDFCTHVVPMYTPEERTGPGGAVSVAIILQPLRVHGSR